MTPESGGAFLQNRIRLRHLRLIRALDEERSVTRAAERLFISQAAASKALAEIEHAVGDRLFKRHGRSVEPTELGRRMILGAHRVLSEFHALDQEIGDLVSGIAGTVNIGVQTLSAQAFIAQAIEALKREHPRMTLRLIDGVLTEHLDNLRLGGLDLVFGRISPDLMAPDLTGTPIIDDPTVLVAGLGHPLDDGRPLTLADVAGQAWCLSPPGTPTMDHFAQQLAAQGLAPPEDQVETHGTLMMLMILRTSHRLALLPERFARHWAAQNVLTVLPLRLEGITAPIGLIWVRDRKPAPAARRCREIVGREIARFRAEGDGAAA